MFFYDECYKLLVFPIEPITGGRSTRFPLCFSVLNGEKNMMHSDPLYK